MENLKNEGFKRYTGVNRGTVGKMLKVVREGTHDFGQTPELTWADQLLMTLVYWREYRTEFQIGRKRFVLCFNLIAAIHNIELKSTD